jgi:hypothetical protein
MLRLRMEMGIAQIHQQLFSFAGLVRTGIQHIPVGILTTHCICASTSDGVHVSAIHSVVPPKAPDSNGMGHNYTMN